MGRELEEHKTRFRKLRKLIQSNPYTKTYYVYKKYPSSFFQENMFDLVLKKASQEFQFPNAPATLRETVLERINPDRPPPDRIIISLFSKPVSTEGTAGYEITLKYDEASIKGNTNFSFGEFEEWNSNQKNQKMRNFYDKLISAKKAEGYEEINDNRGTQTTPIL